MWLLGIVLFQLWFLFSSWWHEYFYAIFFLSLLYILWYFDGKEYTGERRWEGFRSSRLWQYISPARFTISSTTAMINAHRRLFVAIPCTTPLPLWWMSVHGGMLPSTLNLCYMLPPVFFSIPWLRDVIMWSGGVTYKGTPWKQMLRQNLTAEQKKHQDRTRRNTSILELLNSNRSVCYTPSGFSNILNEFDNTDLESGVTTTGPDDELFDFAMNNGVQIIPVVVSGEKKRYRIIAGSRWLRWIHSKTITLLGYPIPLLFWTRIFSNEPPPHLEIQIGPVIHSDRYKDLNLLKQTFRENVNRIRNIPEEAMGVGMGSTEFHLI